MKLSPAEIKAFEKLEESLWDSDLRSDPKHQEMVFAQDFFEFGRSGRIYQRKDVIRTQWKEIKAKLPLENFKVRALDENNVQVTYISEVQYETLERANRSSIWSRSKEGWQLRFHQGTPVFEG